MKFRILVIVALSISFLGLSRIEARPNNLCSAARTRGLERLMNVDPSSRAAVPRWDRGFVQMSDADCPVSAPPEMSQKVTCSQDFAGGFICCAHTDHYSVCCLASPNGHGGCVESHF